MDNIINYSYVKAVKVYYPIDIKKELSIKLFDEIKFFTWWWENNTLYVIYNSREEFDQIANVIRKLSKSLIKEQFKIKSVRGSLYKKRSKRSHKV